MNARTRSRTQTPPKERLDLGSRLGLNQRELAMVTGKSASYYRRLAKLGLGPKAIRAGGRGLIFPLDSVRDWMARNAEDPADTIGR
jgi:predicted DNA-binding transcriptional regulator AlpA